MNRIAPILAFLLLAVATHGQTAQRWKKVVLPSPYDKGYYLDIYFLPGNPNYGWACDENAGYVVRTTDGGTTWQGTKVNPAVGGCHLEYIQFLDQNVGYCSGPCGMYKSVDGGATWTSIKPAGSPTIWGGWFRNANEGWFTGGGCGTSTFLHTVDGGATFNTVVNTEPRSVMSDPYWNAAMPAGTLYAIGSGTLFRSQDYGATWNVFNYTGTNNPWHEELAIVGNSVLIPNSGARCASGPGPTQGMRFSTDMGATWRDFVTGEDMFGTFLLDAQRGWASGWNASAYYTSNSGQTWQARTCGLNGAGLDDIFFVDDNNGWVTGDGLFRTAPALRTQSDSVLKYTGVCPDSIGKDTVTFENLNWFDSPWSATIGGTDASQFRIANAPLAATITSCTKKQVIVEYRPTAQGPHYATLNVTFAQPDTTLVVLLEGSGRQRVAYPVDSLISFNATVGAPTSRSSMWRSSSATNLESIVSITRISGDSTIALTVGTTPAVVRTDGTLTYVTVTPRDTGWIQARFRVRLGPCMRDTIITVRVYGLSPIFNSIPTAYVNTGCTPSDTMKIPVLNTGNAPLNIGAITVDLNASTAFTFVGFASGRKGIPWVIPKGERDTILVVYRGGTGKDNTSLIIQHDDVTTVRGQKNPWTIALKGASTQPAVTISPRVIDLGSICVGSVADRNVTVTNIGTAQVAMDVWTNSKNISGLPQGTMFIVPTQVRQFPISYKAGSQGAFVDTVYVRIGPCDSTHMVIVKGTVENVQLAVTPTRVADSADVGVPLYGRCVIKLAAGDSAVVNDIRIAPLPSSLTFMKPSLPVKLRRGDSIVLTLQWTSNVPAVYDGIVEVTATTSCTSRESAQVHFRAMNADVGVGPSKLSWMASCTATEERKTVSVDVRGGRPVRVFQASIVESGTPFRVIGPPTPFVVDPGKPVQIEIAYKPLAYGVANATLSVDTDVDGGDALVSLEGVFDFTDVTVTPKLIDGLSALICSPPIRKNVTVANKGTIATVVDISDTRAPLGFSVNPKTVNLAPGGQQVVNIDIDPKMLPPNKVSTAQFFFQDRLCGDVDTVTVVIDVGEMPKLEVTPDPLDVSEILQGTTTGGTLTIKNSSMYDLFVRNVRIQQVRPHWSVLSPIMGKQINSGESITADVEYAPVVPGQDSAVVFFEATVVNGPTACNSTTTASLTGSARSPRVPKTFTVLLRADEYKVGPESIVEIPIHLDTDVKDAQLDSLQFTVGYVPMTLSVDSIKTGTAPDSKLVASSIAGKSSFKVYPTGGQFGKPGVLGVIYATAHSAIPDSTPLAISNMFATASEPLVYEHDDGYVIVDACGPRFWLEFDSKPIFHLDPPIPVRDRIRVRVQSKHADEATVEISNSIGQVVRHEPLPAIPPGESQIVIDVQGLSDGIYNMRITSRTGGVLSVMVPVAR